MTTTTPVYAQLAARVYAAKDENRTPFPTNWTELEWIPDRWNGFSAGVYKNGSDIVIAFTGTNGQKTADFGWANLLAATGAPSPQVTEAMLLYFQVKQANPTANITFTGHSLGGGIATMMGIFFDRPATVFDAAPFELGARNLASLAIYKAATSAAGYSDPAFDAYWAAAPTVFYSREPQVKNTFLKGEFLESGRTALTEIGTSTPVDVGTPTNVSAFNELHSMTLLASMLTSSAFATVVRANASLISTLFDQSLYASNAETSAQRDFLTSLYSAQVRPTGSVPLLDRFAADLQRLGTQGVTARADWQKALTVAALDYYYNKDAASATQFFKLESGGLHFSLDDVGVDNPKSLPLLRTAASSTDIGGDPFNVGDVGGARGWHVQTGEGSMYWTASKDANDVAIGGAQGDVLRAGAGSDYLVGGAGDDMLDGGVGYDMLLGGEGNDTYAFTSGEINDTILDTDGNGKIMVDGVQLEGGKKRNDNYWISDDKLWGYLLTTGGDLVISKGFSLNSIVVKGWVNDQLGIHLDDAPAATPATPAVFTDVGVNHRDGNGNIMGWGDAAGHPNFLVDGGLYSSMDLSGLAGPDILLGWGSNDKLDGAGDFARPCRRTRQASVPARLRARGRGACTTRPGSHQHRGLHANSAATANRLRRSGTATRHVCRFGWWGEEDQAQQVHSMRMVGTKWLGRRMDRASSTSGNGVPA